MDSSQILKRARSWAALCQRECTGRPPGSPPHGAKNMKSYFFPLLAVLCVVAAVGWTYSVQPIHQPTLPSAPPPESPAGGGVAGVGLVEPESENVQISCAVSGLVTGLYVKAGDHVSKGQRLFSLDDRVLTADLGVKKGAVAGAEARLKKLEEEPRPEEIPTAEAKRSEEHTSELQSLAYLVCRLLLEK